VSFNTSSIVEEDGEWIGSFTSCYTIEEIRDISPSHTVTHMILGENIPPNIATLFPHLTHLSIYDVNSDTDFSGYSVRL